MLSVYVFFGSLVAALLFLVGLRGFLNSPKLLRENYAGRSIPTAAGLVFVPTYLLAYVIVGVFESGKHHLFSPRESLLLLVFGMAFLGLIDDLLGDSSVRGFRGHVHALMAGRATTGSLKAVCGFLLAVAASFPISGLTNTQSAARLLLNGLLIALCANLFNLLDVRPGRAMKVFFPLLAVVLVLNRDPGRSFLPYLLCVGAAALVLSPGDLRERFMLGDAGSNVLGATIGLGLAVEFSLSKGNGIWVELALVVCFALLNILSEKYSFSSAIEANRVLRWLDMLGRKRTST